jgi:hypothetical protein
VEKVLVSRLEFGYLVDGVWVLGQGHRVEVRARHEPKSFFKEL